jgi:hypothetical protein
MKLELLTNATVVDDAIRFLTGHEKSVSNISSNVGTISGALKDKTDTAQGIQESECTHTSRSTTAKQVF